MTLFYRTIQTLGWEPKRFMLVAAVLFIIAAAPSILPSLSNHTFSIEENVAVGTAVGAILPATDSDNEPLYFEILSGDANGAFALEASTGKLTVANAAALNFEAAPSYSLEVQVTADKGLETEDKVTINVAVKLLDVAELPTVSLTEVSALSESAVTLNGLARSNGAETTVAYQWGTSASFSEVDPAILPGARVLAADAPETAISYSLSGLNPATTYYYRLVAKNSEGTVYSDAKTFTTFSVPTVSSIKRETASPTNADLLKYSVSFSEAVTGVDVTDFSLTKTGTAIGSITTVEAVNASEYLVTLSNVVGDGELRLNFIDNNTVLNLQGVPTGGRLSGDGNYSSGELYLLDNIAPTITITGPAYPYTQIGPSNWVATYSEPCNIILAATDITLIATGTATGTIEVSGTSNTQRSVSIKNISGDGTLQFSIAAGTATDAAGNVAGAAGPSNIVVVDNTAPVGVCPTAIVVQNDLSKCEAYVEVPLPSYNDNNETGVVVITNDRTGTPNASGDYPVGTTTVTWRFTDQSGNYGECSTTITVEDKAAPLVTTPPSNITVGTDPGLCGAVVEYEIPVVDNCSGPIEPTITGPASGSVFPVGETLISYTATDDANNTVSGSFKITVKDTEKPVVQCPNIATTYEVAPGENGVVINYPAVTATDNCTENLVPERTSGFASGATVPAGSHTYTFVATDAAGNVGQCSFTVTVIDDDAPTILISPPSVKVTQNGPVYYDVTYFGATNITLRPEDIKLNLTGTAQGATITVTAVEGQPNVRRVTISNISGEGTISISLLSGTATDGTNLAPAAGPSEYFIVDNTAPGVADGGSLKDDWTYEDIAKAFSFKVTDAGTPAAELQVKVTAANAILFPEANVKLEGVNPDRTLRLTPALHRHGSSEITLTVTDNAGHVTTKKFILAVEAVADKPKITLLKSPATGSEETAIPLEFTVELVDKDGSESLAGIFIENVPADATLSAGTNLGGGKWQLAAADVAGLKLLSEGCRPSFDLSIRAISREASNNNQAESQTSLRVEMTACVNDQPGFSIPTVVELDEDFGDYAFTDVAGIYAPDETSETYTYSISPQDHAKVKIKDFNPATGKFVFESVQDANARNGIAFSMAVSDGTHSVSKSFTLIINPVNDKPYGEQAEEPLAFAVEEEGVYTISPDPYFDVDLNDEPSDEDLTITLENAPDWLSVVEGVTTNAKWVIQLVGTPPKEDEGKLFQDVKAVIKDKAAMANEADESLVHIDLFDVIVVCTNNLPTTPEEEINLTVYMNTFLAPPYEFVIEDDAKALGADGLPLKVEVVEVDHTMISSVTIDPVSAEEGIWEISSLIPAPDQYGETSFRIKISDYSYCSADGTEREAVYIRVNVVIKLMDVLDIPNLITPNGDGANDTWNILGLEEYQNHEVRIFDTRGRMIFYSQQYGPGKEWDGSQNGLPLADGAYTYQIIFNDGKEKREGYISVAR